jgi:hypothetical protein
MVSAAHAGARPDRLPVTALSIAAWIVLAALLTGGTSSAAGPSAPQKPKDAAGLLREIRREVAEMGPYPGEEFIRRDFSLGEGDDDTNKNHHVGILIQDLDGVAVMTIQITKLEPLKWNPRIRHGKDPRLVVCRFPPDRVEITRSDYRKDELQDVLAEVLQAVLDKKSIIKK